MTKLVLLTDQLGKNPTTNKSVDSFDTIYNKYSYRVYRKCLSMTNDVEIAKDLTQDIFIKVHIKMDTFQNRSTFSTWLHAVTCNYCLDHLRASKRTEPLSDVILKETSESNQCDNTDRQRQILRFFMNELQDYDAAMLRLKYEQGLSIKLISEHYNLSESSVKMRLKRSRDKLRLLCSTAIYDRERLFSKPVYS